MEYRILGPLEAWQGDRRIPLGGQRQRALLAVLLLHANSIVSTDRLLDELWGDDQPESGVSALRVRISQLRKSLQSGGGEVRLVTRSPGYGLELDRDELDLHRFERLVEDAREALAHGDARAASEWVEEALGLWRGPALDDLAYASFAQQPIARLEELRLAALELCAEARLALGHHVALVPELQALVATHPLRERLRALLMLTLYRSGRQSDALAAYREARTTLLEELGIEPGPSLQELERAILRQDPELEPHAAPAHSGSADGLPDRSILVSMPSDGAPEQLLLLSARLAARPRREVILATLLESDRDLRAAGAGLELHRARLAALGLEARAAAFTATLPGRDLAKFASEQDVDLALIPAGARFLTDLELGADLRSLLTHATCDVAVFVGGRNPPRDLDPARPVLVPFSGADHDWAAIEVAAWAAGSAGSRLALAGVVFEGREGRRDASRLLANASVAVQRGLGIPAEPLLVPPGPEGILEAAADAALVVFGLSERWEREGLGEVRAAVGLRAGPPILFVRRGLRPSGLAPSASLTRYTWTLDRAS